MVININKLINFGLISISTNKSNKSVVCHGNHINRFPLYNEIKKQCELISIPQYKIIYNSDFECFDAATLFSKIHGRKNVHLLIKTTNNHVFGSIHKKIPSIIKHGYICTDCSIFKLNNNKPPLVIVPKNPNTTIYFGFEEETIFTINDAFTVRKTKGIVYPSIQHQYHSLSNVEINASILSGDRTFSIQQFIAFETENSTIID